MSLADPKVFITDNEDGSAKLTISIDGEDHQFDVVERDGEAVLEYEETLSWRGKIRVSEPDEEVFKALMQSDKVTEWVEGQNLDKVRRTHYE